ncbi:MAG: hypothetical protein WB699_07965 [Bacteroidota bacterium]
MSTRSEAPRQAGEIPGKEKLVLVLVFGSCLIATIFLILSPPRTQHIGFNVLFMAIMVTLTIANGARAMIAKREGKIVLAILLGILSLLFFLLSFAGFGWVCNAVESPV